MQQIFVYVIAGIAGGLVRGTIGLLKNKTPVLASFARKFSPSYFMITIFVVSGIVGGFAGILAGTQWELSFLAGYAGSDFIDGLYKIGSDKR